MPPYLKNSEEFIDMLESGEFCSHIFGNEPWEESETHKIFRLT